VTNTFNALMLEDITAIDDALPGAIPSTDRRGAVGDAPVGFTAATEVGDRPGAVIHERLDSSGDSIALRRALRAHGR